MTNPVTAALATGGGSIALTLDDLCAFAPSRSCIYLPCKSPWPNASVDERLPPMPLLDASGNPVLNAKGKVVMLAASEWLAKNRSVEAMTWAPGEAVGRALARDLSRRRRPHHCLAGLPRAAPERENQPRVGARRRAQDRQG